MHLYGEKLVKATNLDDAALVKTFLETPEWEFRLGHAEPANRCTLGYAALRKPRAGQRV